MGLTYRRMLASMLRAGAGAPAPAPTPPAPTPPAPTPPPPSPTPPPPPAASGVVTLVAVVNRTSGVAPFMLFIDCTASTSTAPTCTDPFRQILYTASFDDGGAGNFLFGVQGLSKNVHVGGPLIAHCYEGQNLGNRTVTITATDNEGNTATTSVVINVQSADAAFPGTQTICYSPSGDFSGAPAGAATTTTPPSWSSASNRRYLIKGTHPEGIWIGGAGLSNIVVAGFGGSKPIVQGSLVAYNGASVTFNGINVQDAQGYAAPIALQGSADYSLAANCDVATTQQAVLVQVGENDDFSLSRGKHIYNVVADAPGAAPLPQYGIFGSAAKSAILNSNLGRIYFHSLRLGCAYKVVIGHSRMSGSDVQGGYHALKLHGRNTVDWGEVATGTAAQATRYVGIHDCIFGDSGTKPDWTVAICPENGVLAELVRDVIIERSLFRRRTGWDNSYCRDIVLGGQRLTVRQNSVDGGGTLLYDTETNMGASGLAAYHGPYNVSV